MGAISETINMYLQNKLRSYVEKFGFDSVNKYKNLYDDIPSPLQEIFSIFHFKINGLLNYMNIRLNSRRYTAAESRDLFYLIDELKTIQANTMNSSLQFNINSDYNAKLIECESFLQQSLGSDIPSSFERIRIIETAPIFQLDSGVSVERSTDKFLFPTQVIGKGSYATVLKYKDSYYKRYFAIKQAFNDLTDKEFERFQTEYEQMRKLKSPFILEVYKFDKEKRQYTMEYANYSLDTYFTKYNNIIQMPYRINLITQVFNAFQYIHSKELLHRDISPWNILIKKYDDFDIIKVADFGLVKLKDSQLTNLNSERKGSFNDPRLDIFGFANYEIRHETYALTRLIHFIITGNHKIVSFPNETYEQFIRKGIADNIEERYNSVQELQQTFYQIMNTLQ
ncbi:protein kinase family protein [Bacillus sp. JJ1127]|uniref:protein kinase family protein n=1 Tax=Bacillus sp. JJ1127 TaxID=3122952 RepID=UPI003000AF24